MFQHNCTFYREENDGWKRYPVYGVLWQDTKAVNMLQSGLRDANSLELYIPFSAGFEPREKDIVLKGIVDYEVKAKPSELFTLGDARTIKTVDIFDYGALKHYEAGGV